MTAFSATPRKPLAAIRYDLEKKDLATRLNPAPWLVRPPRSEAASARALRDLQKQMSSIAARLTEQEVRTYSTAAVAPSSDPSTTYAKNLATGMVHRLCHDDMDLTLCGWDLSQGARAAAKVMPMVSLDDVPWLHLCFRCLDRERNEALHRADLSSDSE